VETEKVDRLDITIDRWRNCLKYPPRILLKDTVQCKTVVVVSKQGCVQSRKKLAKLAFLVLGLVEWFTLAPPYRVMKIVKRLQHLHIEKIF